jgi:hypothetical protein
MVIPARLKHPKKAASPIVVTLFGMVIPVRRLFIKATDSILVTLSGIKNELSVFPAGYFSIAVLSLLYSIPLSET